jgi:hypothetical protein
MVNDAGNFESVAADTNDDDGRRVHGGIISNCAQNGRSNSG